MLAEEVNIVQDKRKHLKDHIKSARSWLKRAEHSLDKDKDIEGDLSVMLAEAELKRARELESKKATHGIFRLAKYTPFLLVFFVVGAYFAYSQAEKSFSEPKTNISDNTVLPKPAFKAKESHVQEKITPQVEVSKRAVATEAKIDIVPKQIEKEDFHEAEESPKIIPQKEQKPHEKLPPLAMQELMNKAVKTLHAE